MPRRESRPRFLGILQDYLPRTYFLMTRMLAAESLMQGLRIGLAVLSFMKPITGIVGCARAVTGHATTAPPMNLMNFRRRMCPP
ncbi:hypothetical protein V1280_004739 [Bradyrhizobium sp. AZCC 2230]